MDKDAEAGPFKEDELADLRVKCGLLAVEPRAEGRAARRPGSPRPKAAAPVAPRLPGRGAAGGALVPRAADGPPAGVFDND